MPIWVNCYTLNTLLRKCVLFDEKVVFMLYVSTRGKSKKLSFKQVILQGLAEDRGLYVPEYIPLLPEDMLLSWKGLSYQEIAFKIIKLFIGDEIEDAVLEKIVSKSYESFYSQNVTVCKKLSTKCTMLELFHGPTLAFKDYALQLLGSLVGYVLEQNNKRAVIIGATSGDTGSAAIHGFKNIENSNIFILHPHKRVSQIQRRQMTCVSEDYVHNLAVKGNFDDCQKIVKVILNNRDSYITGGHELIAVNSINWGRIMAQIVYYVYAYLQIYSGQALSFCAPTGNLGNIFAGYFVNKMGLKVNKLIMATNENDILCRALKNNDYSKKELKHTITPSIDIMISNNFERLIYYLYNEDSQEVNRVMQQFVTTDRITLQEEALLRFRQKFDSISVTEEEVLKNIYDHFTAYNEIIDPHTAVGLVAGEKLPYEQLVVLATAHAAKFGGAISRVNEKYNTNIVAEHEAVKGLLDQEEYYQVVDNDVGAVIQYIKDNVS